MGQAPVAGELIHWREIHQLHEMAKERNNKPVLVSR
jgi:hypothetical protein